MFWFILIKLFYTAIFIILAALLMIFSFELMSYLNYVKKYKKQGLKYYYFPITGLGHFIDKVESDKKDCMDGFNNYFKKERDPIHVSNILFKTTPIVNLTDPELINKFFLQDTDVSQRYSFDEKFMISNSFLFKKGSRALHLRSVMLEIFKAGNMAQLAPMITEKTLKTIKTIKEEQKITNEEFTDVSLNKYMDELFSEIICQILFGKVTGELKEIPILVEQNLSLFSNASMNLWNIITFNLARDKLLLKDARDAKNIEIEVINRLKEECKQRTQEGYKHSRKNVVDLMILNNIKAKEEGREGDVLDIDEMIRNILTIVFAGIDTSRHTTKACLYYLSSKPELRKRVISSVHELEETGDGLKYEECETMIHFVNEALRLKNPIVAFITRTATKNFKLGKYTVYKGDMFSIPMAAIHRKKKFFENPDEFDIDRHGAELSKNRGRKAFLPFGAGRRSCLGKYLALLVVKIILGSFVENFEFEEVKGFEGEWISRVTYGIKDCKVSLKSI